MAKALGTGSLQTLAQLAEASLCSFTSQLRSQLPFSALIRAEAHIAVVSCVSLGLGRPGGSTEGTWSKAGPPAPRLGWDERVQLTAPGRMGCAKGANRGGSERAFRGDWRSTPPGRRLRSYKSWTWLSEGRTGAQPSRIRAWGGPRHTGQLTNICQAEEGTDGEAIKNPGNTQRGHKEVSG